MGSRGGSPYPREVFLADAEGRWSAARTRGKVAPNGLGGSGGTPVCLDRRHRCAMAR